MKAQNDFFSKPYSVQWIGNSGQVCKRRFAFRFEADECKANMRYLLAERAANTLEIRHLGILQEELF